MRRSAELLHSIKDAFRTVRYAVRAEADAPGALLPKTVGTIDLAPFIAVGSTVGKPAMKALDGLLTQVETIATEVTRPHAEAALAYPADVRALLDPAVPFSDLFYPVYERVLRAKGVNNVLLSEHGFDAAQERFTARHGDLRRSGAASAKAGAGLACALAEARPIRKIDFGTPVSGSPVMLAPNIYCAAVVGLATALVTRDASLAADVEALEESVASVVDARFDRFKRAMSGKSPAVDLAAQFETVMPFMP